MSILEMKVNALVRLCAAQTESDRALARKELIKLQEVGYIPADPETQIRELLLQLGAPDHLLGHPYVIHAVMLCIEDRRFLDNITFILYPQVAARFNTTAARVERAIRHLVEVTWARGDLEILNRYFGNTIHPEKGKPTNGEFIARIVSIVQLRLRAA